MIKLKPCPFCGGEAEIERMGTNRQSCIIACTECGCRHEGPDEYDRCGYQWNLRATDQAHAAKTKAEEAELAAAQELDEVRAQLAAIGRLCPTHFDDREQLLGAIARILRGQLPATDETEATLAGRE